MKLSSRSPAKKKVIRKVVGPIINMTAAVIFIVLSLFISFGGHPRTAAILAGLRLSNILPANVCCAAVSGHITNYAVTLDTFFRLNNLSPISSQANVAQEAIHNNIWLSSYFIASLFIVVNAECNMAACFHLAFSSF